MIDKSRLKAVLEEYKQDFVPTWWNDENYKWVAVQTFQDNWNVKAEDFPEMLERSLSMADNLLTSGNYFPAGMITGFAKSAPEEVRAMFLDLFDEDKDVIERILAFKDKSAIMLEKYGDGARQHYQYENAVSTYLWLRYPDKYYIYKYSEAKAVAEELNSNYRIKKGAYAENMRNFYNLYDEICDYISTDTELTSLLKSQLSDNCYPDTKYKTLTVDVGFYISRVIVKKKSADLPEWIPKDYSPKITKDTWTALLNDSEVFTDSSLEIMKRLKDYGGQATCSQLALRYGESYNFYNRGSIALARRVADKTGCPVMSLEDGSIEWWPILYVGRKAEAHDDGVFIWKLRDELSDALDESDLSEVKVYAAAADDADCRYWWLNANPKYWNLSDVKIGETQSYTLYNEAGNKRRIFQHFLNVKAGDLMIGYESYPVKQIVAICRVTAEQDGEKIQFEKVESLASPIDYDTLKTIPELEKMEFFVNPNGSLFSLTKDEFDALMNLIHNNIPINNQDTEKYDKTDFLNQVFMSEQRYDVLVSVLKNKKNIILQGAPGVGKTFAAKRLAYSIMREKDESRIGFVQFHQNYSYEDFMMGYKPSGDGFELQEGIFYQFCRKAASQPEKDFFFIIDEINRGNMSKIFGELLMLIEKDYRGTEMTLAYNRATFSVPENLYIIGMMNTADRSLAMIDYALRRRFSFFEMTPGFDTDGFIRYQNGLNNETFNQLIERIKELNTEITNDRSLGKGVCIGHSYFSNWDECTDEKMKEVVDFDILPMLEEYWFDDTAKLQRWSNILHGVFQ